MERMTIKNMDNSSGFSTGPAFYGISEAYWGHMSKNNSVWQRTENAIEQTCSIN